MKSDMMEYKNYFGSVHYSDEDQVLYGKVEGIRALISYEGNNVASLRKAFEEAVDDYLEACRKEGKKPDIPFKGSFNIRLRPATHRMISMRAAVQGVSLNKYIVSILEREVTVNDVPKAFIAVHGKRPSAVGHSLIFNVVKEKAAAKKTLRKN